MASAYSDPSALRSPSGWRPRREQVYFVEVHGGIGCLTTLGSFLADFEFFSEDEELRLLDEELRLLDEDSGFMDI